MRTSDVAKLVSRAWKAMVSCERLVFLDMAKKDKARYETEKANYKGPWKVIDTRGRDSSKKRTSSPMSSVSSVASHSHAESSQMLTNGDVPKLWSTGAWGGPSLPPTQFTQSRQRKRISSSTYSTFTETVSVISKGTSEAPAHPYDDIDVDSLESLVSPLDVLVNQMTDGFLEVANELQMNPPSFTGGRGGVSAPSCATGNTTKTANVIELPATLDGTYDLQPLISTDLGGYLAAAAYLDSQCEPMFE